MAGKPGHHPYKVCLGAACGTARYHSPQMPFSTNRLPASATSFLDGCITLGTGVSHGIGMPVPGNLSYEISLPTAS